MSEHARKLRFCLISTEPRAYLVLRSDAQSITVEMNQPRPGFWSADVPLAEGTYRARYYCGDENHMFYYGPAPSDDSWSDGLDAVVVVRGAGTRAVDAMSM
jgi:hypothetical protein